MEKAQRHLKLPNYLPYRHVAPNLIPEWHPLRTYR